MFAASHGVILGPILWRARINDPYGSLLTQDILWCNNSNIVLLHVYIKYMEVSNLSSHTIADVYFKKLSLRIASYTDQLFLFLFFFFVISLMSSNDREQQQKSLFEIIAFDQNTFWHICISFSLLPALHIFYLQL